MSSQKVYMVPAPTGEESDVRSSLLVAMRKWKRPMWTIRDVALRIGESYFVLVTRAGMDAVVLWGGGGWRKCRAAAKR